MGIGTWAAQHAGILLAITVASLLAGAALMGMVLRLRARGRKLGARLAQASTELETLAVRDRLTGLRSREEFDLALDEAVLRTDRGQRRFCLLYADVDNLRSVNDLFGHEAGDAVLKEAAARLSANLPKAADGGQVIAARIAADEFALLVAGELDQGRAAAEQVEALFAQPFRVGEREARLTCSIGIAAYPQHGSRPRLMANAVMAMRSVKSTGGGGHAEYDPRMGIAQREQAEMLHDLKSAVARGQLELFYQPKIDARSRQITAAEALLRWRHPKRGLVSPAVFIPLAERHGLINAVGDWVIAEACRQAEAWREIGLRMRVAVNISGAQLRQDDFVATVEARLARHRIPPGRFTCEITESVAMEDTSVTQQAFERLRRAGVHVSIDDFGTGHSSLASLRRLPAAELKIDRAFVSDLEDSADARSIVRAIVQMAHTMELRVVAEGVETEGQRRLLTEMGCDELQGFLFAKPMTPQALALWASDDGDAPATAAFRPSLFEPTAPADLGGR
jgi:diguanylate cyclase